MPKRLVNFDGTQTVETFDSTERDSWADGDSEITERWRQYKKVQIKEYALSLIQSRIPAIDSYEMVGFMKVLWPVLSNPASQADLAYARDVYLYAVGKMDELETATREQIEGYIPEDDPNWPS